MWCECGLESSGEASAKSVHGLIILGEGEIEGNEILERDVLHESALLNKFCM